MDEILNNLEKLSNLLAENDKITIEEFGPISQIIAETEIKVVQLYGVVKSVNEKKLPKIDVYVTDCFHKLKGNLYIKKEDCTRWTIERIIEDYHRQIALQL